MKPVWLICLVTAIFTLSGCQEKNTSTPPSSPLTVHTVTVQPKDEWQWVQSTGLVEGLAQADIHPEVTGRLLAVLSQEGDTVKAGQALFQIDPKPYEATLMQAKATTLQNKAQYEYDAKQAKRYEKLWKAKAVSEQERDEAISTERLSKAKWQAAQAAETLARINLEKTTVRALHDGLMGRSRFNPGALVTANTSLLTTITQPHAMRVNFTLNEHDFEGASLTLSTPVRLWDSAGNITPTTLDFISPVLSSTAATLTLRAAIPTGTRFHPGQWITVQTAVRSIPQVYRVPQRAVYQKPDGSYMVYVIENGKAQPRAVTVGTWKDTDWLIFSGLHPNDQVITTQLQRLKPGRDVTVSPDTSS